MNHSKEQLEKWKAMICGVIDADVLSDEEVSEILGICIDACKRGEIDDTERMLMERLGHEKKEDSGFKDVIDVLRDMYPGMDVNGIGIEGEEE